MTKISWILASTLLLLVACGDVGRDCDPGSTQQCLCVGGGTGVQTCNAEGTAWRSCKNCSDGPDSDFEECTPDCFSKECGDDGCGGLCGACKSGWECDAGKCCVPCACPTCPVGNECPPCDCEEEGPVCQPDACVPECHDRECGDNGCGGSCGSCITIEGAVDDSLCSDGECLPDWEYKTCHELVTLCEIWCDEPECAEDCYSDAAPEAVEKTKAFDACALAECAAVSAGAETILCLAQKCGSEWDECLARTGNCEDVIQCFHECDSDDCRNLCILDVGDAAQASAFLTLFVCAADYCVGEHGFDCILAAGQEHCGELYALCSEGSCGDGQCNGSDTKCNCSQDCGNCSGCCSGSTCKPGTGDSYCGAGGESWALVESALHFRVAKWIRGDHKAS